MKAPQDVVAYVTNRLRKTWSSELAGGPAAWPHAVPAGSASNAALEADFAAAVAAVEQLRTFAAGHDLQLDCTTRRIHGTRQQIPTHLRVPSATAAAAVAGQSWPQLLTRARGHAATISAGHRQVRDASAALRDLAKMSDVDVELTFVAASWFETHHASAAQLTPRQVPVPGLHAKWLNTSQALVANLAGLGALRLAPSHPARIHFTYLDPEHRTAGRRLHDSASVGDAAALAYQPRVVLISENKDTAVNFPPVPGGIAVEGGGRAAAGVASFEWVGTAGAVFYWGDMDADGLEILDGFRRAGVPARSLFMDERAYLTWRKFGTDVDAHGQPLRARQPRPLTHLHPGEAALYQLLTAPRCDGPRRIEQERIPLAVALAQLSAQLSAPT